MFRLRNTISTIRGIGFERLWLLGVVTAGHSVIHWYQQLFSVILPSVKMGLSLNDVQVGTLTTARQLMFGSLTLPSGMLADSFSRRRSLILASALISMGLGYLLFGNAHLFYGAILASGLVGLGIALWHPAAIGVFFYTLTNITAAGVMDVAGVGIQASSFGLTSLVTQAIVLPTPILAGFLVGLYGIESAFLMSAAFLFLAAAVVAPLKL